MAFRPARASRVAPPNPPILEKPAPNQPEFPRSGSRLEIEVKPRTISVEVCRGRKDGDLTFLVRGQGLGSWTVPRSSVSLETSKDRNAAALG